MKMSKHRKDLIRSRLINVLLWAILTAFLVICINAFLVTAAKAASYRTQFENSYSYSVRNQCRKVGKDYGYKWAIDCADRVLRNQRQYEIEQSYIDVNRATADFLRDRTSPRYRR